jgi:hypothetical protein
MNLLQFFFKKKIEPSVTHRRRSKQKFHYVRTSHLIQPNGVAGYPQNVQGECGHSDTQIFFLGPIWRE